VLAALDEGIQAVILYLNKTLQFLVGVPANTVANTMGEVNFR